ncbi:hypothetical protein [Priestia taiwanensis]|uniref:Uncharacterized protein n=1 Tax=Priestia taiwanensis TaxID=1347902 RepID=A0A917AWL2_9BACI|nr:hypothetical protein [Priestia taiwanensis]MBM7363562.1 hypothetical protein [Priestia taiwanensis]GGE76073.1 hypothetical protein GCM10007140_27290 [Priestia taiwanensis]
MSKNDFYADLDKINEKGVLVTGHGKGLVSKNPNINGEYIANDMVRLIAKNGELFGYQGYVEKEDNELTKIEYLLYFFEQSEPNQPPEPAIITAETYLSLSKHNIDMGEQTSMMLSPLFGKPSRNSKSAYSEYEEILKQVNNAYFISVPFTKDENQRATFVNNLIK